MCSKLPNRISNVCTHTSFCVVGIADDIDCYAAVFLRCMRRKILTASLTLLALKTSSGCFECPVTQHSCLTKNGNTSCKKRYTNVRLTALLLRAECIPRSANRYALILTAITKVAEWITAYHRSGQRYVRRESEKIQGNRYA